MKQALGVELDRDLAEALGLDPTAVSAWRRRGKVPDKYVLRAASRRDQFIGSKIGVSASIVALREAYAFALVALAARLIDERISFSDKSYQDVWTGFRLYGLYEYLKDRFREANSEDTLRHAYEEACAQIKEADLPVWLETLG